MVVHKVCSKQEFDCHLEAACNRLIVVDFYATWCGPCKAIAPYLLELSDIYIDVMFLKVDVEEQEELAQEYNISCMPSFIFVKNKGKVAEFSGANKERIRQLLDEHR